MNCTNIYCHTNLQSKSTDKSIHTTIHMKLFRTNMTVMTHRNILQGIIGVRSYRCQSFARPFQISPQHLLFVLRQGYIRYGGSNEIFVVQLISTHQICTNIFICIHCLVTINAIRTGLHQELLHFSRSFIH